MFFAVAFTRVMKIGIVTLWNPSDNYGGMLQTFALQRYLRNIGHDAFIIRYGNAYSPCQLIKIKIGNMVRNTLFRINLLDSTRRDYVVKIREIRERDKKRNFDEFRKNNVVFSSKFYSSLKQIQYDAPQADVYITGSDQMWAKDIREPYQQIKYLNFGDKKIQRIAYAVSFGHSTFPCVDASLFQKLVSRFNKVSMREEAGVKICKDMGIKAERCCDSTLLLSPDNYLEMMSKRKHPTDYAYIYTVNVSSPEEIYWSTILNLCREGKYQPVVTTASGYKTAEECFDGGLYDYATVEDWLSNIYYSKIIFTASFHGIVFSIMFKKDFVYTPLKGVLGSGNDRIVDLLKSAGLSNRIAYTELDLRRLFKEQIDYSAVNSEALYSLIKSSKSFLDLKL